jgi:S1-C subfamily serine protease
VFKINVVSSEPSFSDPWKKRPPSSSSGTGFYIGDGRILTNAHVVANATFITIQRDGEAKPEPAFVRHIAHDCDLAIVEPQRQSFLEDLSPMRLGPLPKLRSPVATIGFPTGGEQVSVTEGVVSRVSYRRYVHHGHAQHLLVQVDSAINPGNSGGPVVQGRLVVGVAFQALTSADNTGYIIPTPVIRRFLKDVEDGRYDGHPDDGLTTTEWTVMNPSTAAFHGLGEADGGIKISHVAKWSAAYGKLEVGDIALAIEGQKIGVDGKLSFQGERVDFRTVYDLKQIGEVVRFTVARDGKTREIDVEVSKGAPHHVPDNVYAKHPKYFVYGGLVFTTLSRSYLRTWGSRWYKNAPLLLRYLDIYADYDEQSADMGDIIVFSKRLPDAVNTYASQNMHGVVTAVDGRPVKSIQDLVQYLEGAKEEFIVIDFWGSNEPLVIARDKAASRNLAINETYGVSPDRWLMGAEVDGAINLETVH